MATWVDLLDPTPDELHDALPHQIHESALERLSAPPKHEDEPRPRLEGQGDYVFGILLVAVAVPEEDRDLLPGDRLRPDQGQGGDRSQDARER